ncbi:hypothetical protein GZ77_03825 [Endozoicomonas montiporae]|uniref:Uncharacterized protein n=2 Tax=Endozoicomonas montiporae TaxID=1027273 RepID=A0A081NB85_9GAMM|nr:hypothetical protein [Endozoicomonas montiporae]AMO56570.1 hypothetical protein EZMO1_2486 [Endozoicomonas montiporae CL-33]KEQ15708.1 hypothetical protein GZ77_03825 [Endozoicomonas montiporae]
MSNDKLDDKAKWLINTLKEPMKEPGTTLNYDPLNKKLILIQMPCHDCVSEAASDEERKEKAMNLLEMVNTLIDAAATHEQITLSKGTLAGMSQTLMRIRNLIHTQYTEYKLDP